MNPKQGDVYFDKDNQLVIVGAHYTGTNELFLMSYHKTSKEFLRFSSTLNTTEQVRRHLLQGAKFLFNLSGPFDALLLEIG